MFGFFNYTYPSLVKLLIENIWMMFFCCCTCFFLNHINCFLSVFFPPSDTSSVMLRRTVNTQPQISRGARGGRDIRITTSRRGELPNDLMLKMCLNDSDSGNVLTGSAVAWSCCTQTKSILKKSLLVIHFSKLPLSHLPVLRAVFTRRKRRSHGQGRHVLMMTPVFLHIQLENKNPNSFSTSRSHVLW